MSKITVNIEMSGLRRRTDAVIAKVMVERKMTESEAILFLLQKAYKPAAK